MSTCGDYSPCPPQTSDGEAIAITIIVILLVLIVIGFISWACSGILNRAIESKLQHAVATVPQTSNVVQV